MFYVTQLIEDLAHLGEDQELIQPAFVQWRLLRSPKVLPLETRVKE
jgi:hypothetical protein